MFDIGVDALIGALSGLIAVLVARAVADPKVKQQLYRAVLVGAMVISFQTLRMTLQPRLLLWNATRQMDAFLQSDRMFSLILSDHPELKQPVQTALADAYAKGDRAQAVRDGERLLTSV